MKRTLRNGSITHDRRMGWFPAPYDARSEAYRITQKPGIENLTPRDVRWGCDEPLLDQGQLGSCVANTFAHDAMFHPVAVSGVTQKWVVEALYFPCQRTDEYPGGEYDGAVPQAGGTSVRSMAKLYVSLGFATSYWWCETVEDMVLALQLGGLCTGFRWRAGMETPKQGIARATGAFIGGHATYWPEVDIKRALFTIANSWSNYGIGGYAQIPFEDVEILLREGGEICVLSGRHYAPVVIPTPPGRRKRWLRWPFFTR